MVHAVPDGGGGGAGRYLPRQAGGADHLTVQPLGRLPVHSAGSGGQVDDHAVLSRLPEPRTIQNEGGRCVENQVKPVQLPRQRSGLDALTAPGLNPGQIPVLPGRHRYLGPQGQQPVRQQPSDPAITNDEAPAAVERVVRGLHRQIECPLRRGDGVSGGTRGNGRKIRLTIYGGLDKLVIVSFQERGETYAG